MSTPKITLTFTWHILVIGFLILFIGLSALSVGGYVLYKKVIAAEATQKAILQSQANEQEKKEAEAQTAYLAQQDELTQAKTELEKTKAENQKTQATIKTLKESIDQTKKQDTVISSVDLTPYITGVVQVVCSTQTGISSGSGSLFTFKELPQAVLTNHHVVDGATNCVALITDTANRSTGMFALDDAVYTYNKSTDEAILGLATPLTKNTVPKANYNYSLSSLSKCSSLVPVGTPVVVVGFPAYAKRDAITSIETIGQVNSVYRTVTNGIISGYDTSTGGDANYFISAKIDSGNSGGIALAKDQNGLCVLGLPTWLTVGNFETQGLVQNINNLLPH